MSTIAQNELLAKMPIAELEDEIETFVEPVTKQMIEEERRKQSCPVSCARYQCSATAGDHTDSALSGAD